MSEYDSFSTPVAPAATSPYDGFSTPVAAPKANPYDSFSTPVQSQAASHAGDWAALPQGTEGSVPQAQADETAHRRAAAQIQDIEEGRTFQKLGVNEDGSANYGYVHSPNGGRKLSDSEKLAIYQAHSAQVAGRPMESQSYGQMAAGVRQASAAQNTGWQDFAGSAANSLANAGLGIEGQFAPQAANRQQDNLGYTFDPNTASSMAGQVVGTTLPMLPALVAGPAGADVMAAQMAAQAAGEARMEVARRRAAGEQISPAQESMYVADKAAVAAATGKISANAMVGKPLQAGGQAVNEFAANGLANAAIGTGKAAATGAADMGVNQIAGNLAAKGTGVDANRAYDEGLGESMAQGGVGAAVGHAIHAVSHKSLTEPQVQTPEVKTEAAPVESAPAVPADVTPKPSETPAEPIPPKPSEHPPELADAKQVGDWYGKTFNDPANAQTIEALTSMHPGKYKLMDVPVDQIDPNTIMASDTNRSKVDAIKKMTPEERAAMPPVIAVGEGDKLSIADGSHRLTAAQEAGDKTIKAYVPEAFANDPAQLKRFIAGDVSTPAEKATSTETPSTKEVLPKIPTEARSAEGKGWSHSKLKKWASDNGYLDLGQAHNLDALRKEITRQRNNSMIDLPQPTTGVMKQSFKKLKYWAEQSGYDVSKVEGRRDLKEAIKFQRKSAIAEARGKPLSDEAKQTHADTIQAIKNARKSIQQVPPSGESTSHEPRAPKTFEELFTPIKSRIEDISKPVAGRVMRMEYDTMRTQADWINPLEKPGERLLAELGPKTGEKYTNFKVAMLNGDVKAAKALVPDALHADVDAWFNSSKLAHAHMTAAGAKVGTIENHIGRELNDVKGLKQLIGNPDKGPIAEAWDTARETLGKKTLTDAEKMDIANKVTQGFGPRKPGQTGPGFAKERNVVVTPENAKFYKDPFESQINYLKRAASYAEKTRFLGQGTKLVGREDPNGKLRDSIGAVVQPEIDSGRLTADKAGELHDLLHTLFTADSMKSSPVWKTTKDLVHAATLSQFRNAVNQITDVAITAYDYGTGRALKGVKDALHITPAEGRIIAKELGIEHGGYQFRDAGKIGQYVDKVTRVTGFQHLDIFGKENRLNGAYQYAQDAARDPSSKAFKEMESKYKDMLGDRWDAAVADLKAGKKTADSQFIPFLELTRLQPVTKANMPEAYLKTAKGRVLYALKSFMLNQLDFVRRDVVRNLATSGQRMTGLKNMASLIAYLGVANFGKDLMVDLIRGKRISPEQVPQRAADSLLGIIGLSSFLVKEAVTKPSDAIMDFLGPPTPVIDDLAHDAGMPFKANKKGFTGLATIRTLPGIGDLLYYWTPLGRGYYMNQDEAKKEYTDKLKQLRTAADEAEKDGDPSARELIALYNHTKSLPPPEYVNSGVKPRPAMTVSSAHADNQRAAQRIQIIAKRKAVVAK